MKGTVRWFEPKKGFGFIAPDDGTSDVFVHCCRLARVGEGPFAGHAAMTKPLQPGEKVEFDAIETRLGRQATQVTRVEA